MKNNVLSLLSLCQRAGRLQAGEFLCERVIKSKKVELLIIAQDASQNTKDKFMSNCDYYGIPYRIFSDKETLGKVIGKGLRATIAITDNGFAKSILNGLDAHS